MSKSESRKASVTLSFRLTPDEHAAILAASSMQGIGPTTLARRAAFAAASLAVPVYEQKQPDPQSADLARVLGQLGRLASSANQLARNANASGEVKQVGAVYLLTDELKGIRKELREGNRTR